LSFDLASVLSELRQRVDARLRESLGLLRNSPQVLQEAVAYSLLSPGKRLRPLLTILACEACGGTIENSLKAACAVEMVHTYSLVHDDLPAMDDDDLRRGQPTCHKKFGEALAILVGDTLLTLAFELVASSYPPATATMMCRELAAASGGTGMVGGQVEDLTWEGKIPGRSGSCTIDDLEAIHAKKTGALFRASLKLGLYAAQGERNGGPDRKTTECLDEFGRNFGLLFQVTDDLLDAAGDAEVAGKRVGKDAAKGKPTYPGLMGVDQSRRFAEILAERAESALRPLGAAATPLTALARSIVARDR